MSTPVLAMFDNFFPHPDEMFDIVAGGEFGSYESIWDGVSYPGINQKVPAEIAEYVKSRIEMMMNKDIVIAACFARVMTTGMVAPHRIHSDKVMGAFSMHIYLSKEWPGESGTSFWTHKTQGHKHTDITDVHLVDRDHDKLDQWTRNIIFLGKYNRAVLHDACLFHSAEPGRGWGDDPKNGRLVLTTFFSEAK